MKKVLFCLAIIAFTVVACSQSPEGKANKLIKNYLNKTLYKPETYQPTETLIDSAFAPYDSYEVYQGVIALNDLLEEYSSQEWTAKQTKIAMSLWRDNSYASYAKNLYQDAKEKYDNAMNNMNILNSNIVKRRAELRDQLKNKRKFIGYKATHNYRANANNGNTCIENQIFFIDKDFEKIIYSVEVEEYNKIQEILSVAESYTDSNSEQ